MRRSVAVVFSLLALVCTCQFPGCPAGDLEVRPKSARPGQKIQLHQDNGRFQTYDSLRVVVGPHAAYVRLLGNNDADVMVPIFTPAGSAIVRLMDGQNVKGTAKLAVKPPDCVQLVMRVTGGVVQVVRVEPCRGGIRGDVPSLSERLSYDLVDGNGRLLYTASILHPLKEGNEVFSRSGSSASVSRAPASSSAVFKIRVPVITDARDILLYDAAAGLNLADSTDRSNRVLLESIQVQAIRDSFGVWTH